MSNPVYQRRGNLLEAELGDELVALDPESGVCFGFNSVAASIWRELEQPKRFDQLRDALVEEYDVEPARCAAELGLLLDDLLERNILIAVNSGSDSTDASERASNSD